MKSRKVQPGREMFWLSTHMYLRSLRDELGSKMKKTDKLPLSNHTVGEMSEHLQRELEFNDEERERFNRFIDSYEDRDTGYEAALLKLQTMFVYTGKPFGEMIPIKAARHP